MDTDMNGNCRHMSINVYGHMDAWIDGKINF